MGSSVSMGTLPAFSNRTDVPAARAADEQTQIVDIGNAGIDEHMQAPKPKRKKRCL